MIVISLGGSLIYPETIDVDFLNAFRTLILDYVKKGKSFTIICGGGKLARTFQETAENLNDVGDEEKDWIGIFATKMNARLVKSMFPSEVVYEQVVDDPTIPLKTDKKVIVCSGWKPGWSTDYDAVLLADQLQSEMVINMSNIDQVFSADPKKDPSAKPLDSVSWEDFRKMVGDEWTPGMNAPFDPLAAKFAQEKKMKVLVIGKDLDNLTNVLEEKEFLGTTIN